VMVAENLVVQNLIQWNVIFTNRVQDWEMDMVLSFFARLYSISVQHGEDDKLIWNLSKRGLFEVKSYYEVLNRKDGPSFPWKSIWRVKVSARVAFFVWTTNLGKF